MPRVRRAGAWFGSQAPNADRNDHFGAADAEYDDPSLTLALSASGDTLAVGATGEASCTTFLNTSFATDNDCVDAGAAYVYIRTGSSWTFQSYIKRSIKVRPAVALPCTELVWPLKWLCGV